jgi:hypothetical protein
MIRKQIYIESYQDVLLKKKARLLRVTEAELVRRAIEAHLGAGTDLRLDRTAWEEEKIFITGRIKPAQKTARRNWQREELYDR